MKRPLIPVALFLVLGILLGPLPVPLSALFATSFLLVLLFAAWARARPALLCALIVLTGWTNHARRTAILSPYDLRVIFGEHEALVTVRGKLLATPSHRVHLDLKKNTNYWTTTAEIELAEVNLDGEHRRAAGGPGFNKNPP
jgi:hypothetical protein